MYLQKWWFRADLVSEIFQLVLEYLQDMLF